MKTRATAWLAATVLIHFLVTLVHGAAHNGAHVPLGPASALFVLIVIEILPLVGLATAIRRPRAGGLVVAGSMAGALVFGAVNHFLIVSPDHVAEVAAAWRPMFAGSAALLVLSEGAGVMAGLGLATQSLEERS